MLHEASIDLTPTGLLMEGDYTQNHVNKLRTYFA